MAGLYRSEPFDGAFETAFEHSMDAVLITNPDGRILTANPAACTVLGATEEEIRRSGRQGFTKPDDPRWVAALEERAKSGHVRAVLPMFRADGTQFFAEFASSTFAGPEGEQHTCVILRDVTDRVRLEQHLRATREVTQNLLAGKDTSDVLSMIASHACDLVDATDAAIVNTTNSPQSIVVATAEGSRFSNLRGRSYLPSGTVAAQVVVAGTSMLVEDLSAIAGHEDGRRLELGPAIVVPIRSDQRTFGVLVVASADRLRRPFDTDDLAVVEGFAKEAAVALALGEARAEVQQLAVTAEQRRIAADLHDSVIQQLFALGLHLLQLKEWAPPPISKKIDESLQEVDEVIGEIRHTIHGVRNTEAEGGLDDKVRQMAADAENLLGFAPRVTVCRERIGTDVATQVLMVLREALSNVVRHAHATDVEVTVAVGDGEVVLHVVDNGVGPPEGPTQGWGLENMAQRAADLGGRFSIRAASASGKGTILEWRAPDDRIESGPSRSGRRQFA